MTSTTFFIIFIPILAILLLAINLILAPHNPYQEKDSVFECGFHSFLGQNRTQFSISFFIFGLLFLLFDLEILLVYPYSVSSYTNDIYGLVVMMMFFVLLTLGFIFELGKNALSIDSRQTSSYNNGDLSTPHAFLSSPLQSRGARVVKLFEDFSNWFKYRFALFLVEINSTSTKIGVSLLLRTMTRELERRVDAVPSGREMRENRSLAEIANLANSHSLGIARSRDNIITLAQHEMRAPNIRPETVYELRSVVSSARVLAHDGIHTVAEGIQAVLDTSI